MTLTCFASAETVKHERVYAVTNADSVKLYKNDRFVKEFRAADSPYTHLKTATL